MIILLFDSIIWNRSPDRGRDLNQKQQSAWSGTMQRCIKPVSSNTSLVQSLHCECCDGLNMSKIPKGICKLAGEGLVVSKGGPGLFLQGLAVHGFDGTLLEGEYS